MTTLPGVIANFKAEYLIQHDIINLYIMPILGKTGSIIFFLSVWVAIKEKITFFGTLFSNVPKFQRPLSSWGGGG